MPTSDFSLRFLKTCVLGMLALSSVDADAALVSATDAFTGATILSTSNVLPFGAEAAGSFDGSEADPFNVTFFNDVAAGSLGSITFSTGGAVTLGGIRLFAGSDGAAASYARSMNAFRFYADADGDSVFEELVNLTINPDYTTGVIGDADPLSNEIELTFLFSGPITSSIWKYEVNQGVSVGLFDGVRLQEVDAIAATIPEPASLALLVIGLVGIRGRSK